MTSERRSHWSRACKLGDMGRGVSSGGGQSSLGYLFGSDPAPAATKAPSAAALEQQHTARQASADAAAAAAAKEAAPAASQAPRELPAAGKAGDSGTSLDMGAARLGRNSNNYHRADGQNTGNFITVTLLLFIAEISACILPFSVDIC